MIGPVNWAPTPPEMRVKLPPMYSHGPWMSIARTSYEPLGREAYPTQSVTGAPVTGSSAASAVVSA